MEFCHLRYERELTSVWLVKLDNMYYGIIEHDLDRGLYFGLMGWAIEWELERCIRHGGDKVCILGTKVPDLIPLSLWQ